VVVGLPLSLRGEDTAQTLETREFARRLAQELSASMPAPVPVEMHDERFTTRMAQRMQGAGAAEDSRAAAHLLESWLAARDGAQHSASSR
jgi:putative holliday junction resolvase